MAGRIKLTLTGFDEMLKDIEAAGGDMKKAVESCMKQSAHTVYREMKSQMRKAPFKEKHGVDDGLINRMPAPTVKWEGNRCVAEVGYKKGQYNPRDPSDGYKALFLNYGTPRIAPTEYIAETKKQSKKILRKQQKQTFEKILERVKK